MEASLHTAQAAQANYNTFVNKGTEATLAGKQAHDASVSAWDAHKTAVQLYTAAQTAETQAQTKADAATKAALQPLLAYGAALRQEHARARGSDPGAGRCRHSEQADAGVDRHSPQQRNVRLSPLASGALPRSRQASRRSPQPLGTGKMTDPANAARQAMALLTQGAGASARESGHVPTSIGQIVAAAQKSCTPPCSSSVMKFWITAAQKAGVEIPGWVRQAAGQSATEAGKLATGVRTPLAGLPAAGHAAGSGLATGVSTGISSKAGAAIAQARALVAQVKAIGAARGAAPPRKWASAEGRRRAHARHCPGDRQGHARGAGCRREI